MTISPLVGNCCRYYPSCSEYTIQSIETKGIIQGIFKGFSRIVRCHPYHPGGFDPVN